MSTICLCMIVRDEAHVLKRCIESALPFVTHWAIVDTGSKDGTQELARRELAELPGQLIERPWQDFATNRNQALELGRATGADYLLIIDADEAMEAAEGFGLPELTHDSYALPFVLVGTDNVWARRCLLKASLPWRFVGEIHEYPECPDAGPCGKLEGLAVRSYPDGARSRDGAVAKAQRDAETLERLVEQEPDNPRHWFYLAQTLAGAQRIDEAIAAYERRATLGGFAEERYHSLVQIAALREFRGDDWQDVARAYREAFNDRPWRAEPLWSLAVLYCNAGEYGMAEVYARAACNLPRPAGDALIVSESVYLWRAQDELAGILARLGRTDEALAITRRLMERGAYPPAELDRARDNVAMLEATQAAREPAAAE